MTSKVYIMCGLPGSGKSTWVKQNAGTLPVVSRDIIRYELGYVNDKDAKVVLDYKKECNVNKHEDKMVDELLGAGVDFVIDDTNIKKEYRRQIVRRIHNGGGIAIGVIVNTPADICSKRRADRIPGNVFIKHANWVNNVDDKEFDKIIRVND